MRLQNILNNKQEIFKGHVNELRHWLKLTDKKEEDIFLFRKKICDQCPMRISNTCSTNKWIHPETMEVSSTQKNGFVNGCGCRLSAKQKSLASKCPAGFWKA